MRGELQKLDGASVVAAFNRGETVTIRMDDTDIVLSKEDVLVEAVKKEGFTSQVDGQLTVVLDTNLNEDLIREGYAREFISKVQTMRKDAGFDVTDRIEISCTCKPSLQKALENSTEMILSGVLGKALTFSENAEGESVKEWDINGESAVIGVKRV